MTGPRPDEYEEQEAVSPDGRLRVLVSRWRKGTHAYTSVTLIAPTASGPIYGVEGLLSGIRATWIDNATVLVETPRVDRALVRCREIWSLGVIVRVEYRETVDQ